MYGKGLEKLPYDDRDYSHDEHFGTLGGAELPTEDFTIYDQCTYTIKWGDTLSSIAYRFGLNVDELAQYNAIKDPNKIRSGSKLLIPKRTPKILNQLDLDFCTAFSTAELQYAIHGVHFDPFWQMAKIKQIRGEYKQYGANLRDAAKSVVKFGSLNAKLAPYTHATGGEKDRDRDFLAFWKNYPFNIDSFCTKYSDASYFAVDGQYDAFDNIRSTLWMHRNERRAVIFGLMWHPEWTEAKDGIIPDTMPTASLGGGHAMAIVGQKKINGTLYLIFQQSWGDTAGDNGFYYFPRSIINRCAQMGFGMFTFSKVDTSGLGIGGVFETVKSFLGKILR